jgi:nicotinamide-nucleotide amidase
MIVELINTGTELMLGAVLNTHEQWLCGQFADLGYPVQRQTAVPDTGAQIQGAVREALSRADLVITTGGLGPTSDDLTRDLIAELLGKPLREDPAVLAAIRKLLEGRRRIAPARVNVQAMVPEGAVVLANFFGTAPGLAIEVRPNPFRGGNGASWLIMLPGPPRELRPMFTDEVVPLLKRVLPAPAGFVCRTLRVTGLGESMVQEKIAAPLQSLVEAGLEIGYCARLGQVDVRLVSLGSGAMVQQAEQIVRGLLGRHVFADNGEELEHVLVHMLTGRNKTLALAESCTGGCIANRVTNVPGASAVLLAGLVTYSNQAKRELLGVRSETLEQHGAVSGPVAREMAEGALKRTGADYALSVTGIAGPSGGTPGKPVGTVFIGMAARSGTFLEENFNPYDREAFKQVSAQQAMDLLRRKLLDETPS